MYQLCTRNEYGETSIVNSSTDLEALVEEGKGSVKAINVDNALTASEKERSWEAFFVEIVNTEVDEDGNVEYGSPVDDVVYAGYNAKGKHVVLNVESGEEEETDVNFAPGEDLGFKFYLGEKESGDRSKGRSDGWYESWYAADDFKRPVTSLGNPLLLQKTVFFIKHR